MALSIKCSQSKDARNGFVDGEVNLLFRGWGAHVVELNASLALYLLHGVRLVS